MLHGVHAIFLSFEAESLLFKLMRLRVHFSKPLRLRLPCSKLLGQATEAEIAVF